MINQLNFIDQGRKLKLMKLLLPDILKLFFNLKASHFTFDRESNSLYFNGSQSQRTIISQVRNMLLRQIDVPLLQYLSTQLRKTEDVTEWIIIADFFAETFDSFQKINLNPRTIPKIDSKYQNLLTTLLDKVFEVVKSVDDEFESQLYGPTKEILCKCFSNVFKYSRNIVFLSTLVKLMRKYDAVSFTESPRSSLNTKMILPCISKTSTISSRPVTLPIKSLLINMVADSITCALRTIQNNSKPALMKRSQSALSFASIQKPIHRDSGETPLSLEETLRPGMKF